MKRRQSKTLLYDDRTKGKIHKLKKGKFSLDSKEKKKFTMMVVKYENRLPREVMESLSLEIIKT